MAQDLGIVAQYDSGLPAQIRLAAQKDSVAMKKSCRDDFFIHVRHYGRCRSLRGAPTDARFSVGL